MNLIGFTLFAYVNIFYGVPRVYYKDNDLSSVIIVAIGMVLFFTFLSSQVEGKRSWFRSNEKMDTRFFIYLFFMFFICLVTNILYNHGIESIINRYGFSIFSDTALEANTDMVGFAYLCLFGPISEEIIFRGFILHDLSKHNVTYGVIVSSLLFSSFHGNFAQFLSAFIQGLVLAYIAMHHNILWSMLLHIINNVYASLQTLSPISVLFSRLELSLWVLLVLVNSVGFYYLVVSIINWKNRSRVKREKAHAFRYYLHTFTVSWVLIFLLFNLVTAFHSLYPLIQKQ
jgi:membrane protease YdiL (CAAX protease family)